MQMHVCVVQLGFIMLAVYDTVLRDSESNQSPSCERMPKPRF